MNFVLAMTVRELRSSARRLVVFFVCIALGVGAIVALRSLIESAARVFAGESRALLAGDLVVSSSQPFDVAHAHRIDVRLTAAGARSVQGVDVATMVRKAGAASVPAPARMVELRAIEAGFPLYGQLQLASRQPFAHALLRDGGALVRPELLAQLAIAVGDRLRIGERDFTVRGVVLAEPARRIGLFSFGSRVFIDFADLPSTGLLTYGSRATYQRYARVAPGKLAALTQALRGDLAQTVARVRSVETMAQEIGENFGRAQSYLSLMGLVILVLGGVGVSSVIRVFVQQKARSIAVLKCVGARSSQLLAIYMVQVLVLGLLGGGLGIVLAAAAIAAIPARFLAEATPGVQVSYGVTASAAAQGLLLGLLVAVAFSLPPLLRLRHVKPSLLLRETPGVRQVDWVQALVTLAVSATLLALTMWQAGSVHLGLLVAVGSAATALLLHGAGSALVRAIAPLAGARWFPLRHATLKLTRPGSQTRVVLLAVGLASFFALGVRSLQASLLHELRVDLAGDAPDTFLLDVQADQLDAVRAVLREHRPSGAAPARFVPVLRARVASVSGKEVRLDQYENVRARGSLGREFTVTYRAQLEHNETLVEGEFWPARPPSGGEVSIEESLRAQYNIALGDTLRFDVLGRSLSARVTSIRKVDWSDTRAGGFVFVFRPGLLDHAPHAYFGFFHGPDGDRGRAALQSALVARFPNVSLIDGRELLAMVHRILENVSLAVSLVGALVLLSGLLILIGAVAMTRYRRAYEVAIFKTLGATRRLMAMTLVLEYGVLGALGGAVGSVAALAFTWAVSRIALQIPFRAYPGLIGAGIAVCALLVALVGTAASWSVLRQKPAHTLRAE